ncbi:MAG: DUF5908 family protein [Candidatus Brocadiaceae bacterium]
MPIEIKELHIRVSVNTPQIGQPGGVEGLLPAAILLLMRKRQWWRNA